MYEIYSSPDNKRFLVFLLSVFRVSMAYDEDLMLENLQIGLQLWPEHGKASLFQSRPLFLVVAYLASAALLSAFLVALYKWVLPAHIKNRIFGVANSDAATSLPAKAL